MSKFRHLATLAVCFASSLTIATGARADLTHSSCVNASPYVNPHNLVVFANAYLPRELYVASGDLVKFHNQTGFRITVKNANNSNQNLVTSLENGQCRVFTVSGTQTITMSKPSLTNGSNNSGKQGFIRFGSAPNQ